MEANLARKASDAKDPKLPPEVIEGKVYRRDAREEPGSVAPTPIADASPPTVESDSQDLLVNESSPAADRKADAVVQRATRGLMRVDSRRRFRATFRRLFLLCILLGLIAGLGYYVFDDAKDWFNVYWETMKQKIEISSQSGS